MPTSLEQRVTALETRFDELLKALQKPPAEHAWRNVVGLLADDPQIREFHKETQRIREEDRATTRDGGQSDAIFLD